MDLSQWTDKARKQNLKAKGEQRDRHISMAIQTKTALQQSEKLKKQIAYEDKMQRFRFRMRREEIAALQRSWFTAATFASSVCDFSRGLQVLKVGTI